MKSKLESPFIATSLRAQDYAGVDSEKKEKQGKPPNQTELRESLGKGVWTDRYATSTGIVLLSQTGVTGSIPCGLSSSSLARSANKKLLRRRLPNETFSVGVFKKSLFLAYLSPCISAAVTLCWHLLTAFSCLFD